MQASKQVRPEQSTTLLRTVYVSKAEQRGSYTRQSRCVAVKGYVHVCAAEVDTDRQLQAGDAIIIAQDLRAK